MQAICSLRLFYAHRIDFDFAVQLMLLRLFAHVRVDEGTRVEQAERELAMNLKSIDHAFRLARDDMRWMEHFEAELVISATTS